MPDPQTPAPTKKRRGPRRDYKQELKAVEAYATAAIDVLSAQSPTEFITGQIAFAQGLLKKVQHG